MLVALEVIAALLLVKVAAQEDVEVHLVQLVV